jgi:DNA-binding CsgD family transcriptional regulator
MYRRASCRHVTDATQPGRAARIQPRAQRAPRAGGPRRPHRPGAADRALAAEGLCNREIGQRLCLSHRTISTHLYRAFPKLRITSRGELGSTLSRPLR